MLRKTAVLVSALVLGGCATLASSLTLDTSLNIIKRLVELTYGQQDNLARPEQRNELLALKSEVDGVVRTVSEVEDLPPDSRRQALVSVLPQLNNSLSKSFHLAQSVAAELGGRGSLMDNMVNSDALREKREFGSNLLQMYRQLAILKKKIWLALDQPEKARKLAEEYSINMRLMQALCAQQSGGVAGQPNPQCLTIPPDSLPDETVAAQI